MAAATVSAIHPLEHQVIMFIVMFVVRVVSTGFVLVVAVRGAVAFVVMVAVGGAVGFVIAVAVGGAVTFVVTVAAGGAMGLVLAVTVEGTVGFVITLNILLDVLLGPVGGCKSSVSEQ